MNQLLALVEVHLRVVAREAVPCAADGKPLFIQQAPYLPDDQHVLALIVPAGVAGAERLEAGGILLPKAEHKPLEARQSADFTHGEITLPRAAGQIAVF